MSAEKGAQGEARFQVAQEEFPFALVQGEPLLRLPQDLYIPPDALEVFLETFEGPLDVLLYLIKRQNLDVLNIPIAEITRQYMGYIEVMQELRLELAAEYLVMAAMLAEIKSRMLLPRPGGDDEDEDDPRAELIRRLQEYERYKKAAEDLDTLPRLERDHHAAHVVLAERKVVRKLPDITLKEMLLAFKDVMARAEMFARHHIQREPLSVRQRMSDVLSRLTGTGFHEFRDLFDIREGRVGVVVTFLAILELIREALVEVVQTETYGPIHVKAAGAVEPKGESEGEGELDGDRRSSVVGRRSQTEEGASEASATDDRPRTTDDTPGEATETSDADELSSTHSSSATDDRPRTTDDTPGEATEASDADEPSDARSSSAPDASRQTPDDYDPEDP